MKEVAEGTAQSAAVQVTATGLAATALLSSVGSNQQPEDKITPNFGVKFNATSMKETIEHGRVYVLHNFLNSSSTAALRDYVLNLLDGASNEGRFQPSGLSNKAKGRNQNFGGSDRMVCPIAETDMNHPYVANILSMMRRMRLFLSANIRHRSSLADDQMEHEAYFSLSLPGAFLKRHLDERHEELKGRRGCTSTSRRSISWLVYLCDEDWNMKTNGGALRSFVPDLPVCNAPCGAHDGNLQIGWLQTNSFAEPVFLDCWRKTSSGDPKAALYKLKYHIDSRSTAEPSKLYITPDFALHDSQTGVTITDFTSYISEEYSSARLLKLEDLALAPANDAKAGDIPTGTIIEDIPTYGGTLVMFDSVAVPHEVLETIQGKRIALAGWFHESVQSFPDWYLQRL